MKKRIIGAAISLAILGGVGVGSASADPAVVINSGRDGSQCVLSLAGVWPGDATAVKTSSGNVKLSCSGPIQLEVDKAEKFDVLGLIFGQVVPCKVVVTPGGRFSASCHN